MSKQNELAKYILVVDDIAPKSLCDQILAEYAQSTDWKDATVADSADQLDVKKDVRSCMVIPISDPSTILSNKTTRQELDTQVFHSMSKALHLYKTEYPRCSSSTDRGYDLLKYETGGFYSTHTDSFTQEFRTVSCSLALNDDYSGGEFSFFGEGVSFSLKQGQAILFPSNFMYPHQIKPVTSGTRYSIVTWFF